MIGEIHDVAGQHEVIVENLTSVILRDIQLLVQQVKQDRKKVGGVIRWVFVEIQSQNFLFHLFIFCIFRGCILPPQVDQKTFSEVLVCLTHPSGISSLTTCDFSFYASLYPLSANA